MHRLVIALVALIGIAGAAYLAGHFLLLSVATDRASTMVPATTSFYANVYLQPSAGQQMNLAGLIGRLPGFADDADELPVRVELAPERTADSVLAEAIRERIRGVLVVQTEIDLVPWGSLERSEYKSQLVQY